MTTKIRYEKRFKQPVVSGSREFTKGLNTRQPSDLDQYLDVRGRVLFSEFKFDAVAWSSASKAMARLSGGQNIFFKSQLVKEKGDSVCALVRHEVPVSQPIDYFYDVKQFCVMFAYSGGSLYDNKLANSNVIDGEYWYEFNNSWNESPLSVLKRLRDGVSRRSAA